MGAARQRDAPPGASRALLAAGLLATAAAAVLLCLAPKIGNDLWWQLRAGQDILATGEVPRVDVYSWTCRGTPWDVPEWLAFVVMAALHQRLGLLGPALMLVAATFATSAIVVASLRRQGCGWTASVVLVDAMLLAMAIFLQPRPYAFTYVLLALGMSLLVAARDRPRLLWWLAPVCAVWTNLHQGVVVMAGLVLAAAGGDALAWMVARGRDAARARALRRRALGQGLAAALCLVTGMASPYGWRVYRNVAITLADPVAMRVNLEWNPITAVPFGKVWAAWALLAVVVLGLVLSKRRREPADVLVVLGLSAEALLHLRNIPLFAIGVVVVAGVHVESAVVRVLEASGVRFPPRVARLLGYGAVACFLVAVTASTGTELSRAIGPRGWTAEGVAEASVRRGSFPEEACAFVQAQGFPENLRIFNNYEIGGWLIWRLPEQPVFVDGRNDVFTGPVMRDFEALRRASGPDDVREILARRDFECVLTTAGPEARAFLMDPDEWVLVYAEARGPLPPGLNRCWILLRNRPEFAELIARCRSACPALRHPLR